MRMKNWWGKELPKKAVKVAHCETNGTIMLKKSNRYKVEHNKHVYWLSDQMEAEKVLSK